MLVFGQPERRQLRRTVAIITFFSIVSILVNYLYIRALGVIAPADVTAIFSCFCLCIFLYLAPREVFICESEFSFL